MGKIFLVRHGQTLWNLNMRFQGSSDIELSEEGEAQAAFLAERLKTEKLAAVYASDLRRAVHTAQIVAKPHDLSVTSYGELREINCGEWEGLNRVEIEDKYPGQLEKFFSAPANFSPPGGESFHAVGVRSLSIFDTIAQNHKNENIVVVAHGGVIRAILGGILMMDQDALWRIRQDNTALNIISMFEKSYIVELMNDISHLFMKNC